MPRVPFLASDQLSDPASVDPVELGDEVRGALHAMVRNVAEVLCRHDVARFGCDASQSVKREDFHVGVIVATRVVEDVISDSVRLRPIRDARYPNRQCSDAPDTARLLARWVV